MFSYVHLVWILLTIKKGLLLYAEGMRQENMYLLCKIISRQQENFQFLRPKNQQIWLLLTNFYCFLKKDVILRVTN